MANIETIREFYRLRRKIKRRRLILTAAATLSLTLLLGAAVIIFLTMAGNVAAGPDDPSLDSASTIETEEPAQTSPPDTSVPETDPPQTEIPNAPEDYDFTLPVPESGPVEPVILR